MIQIIVRQETMESFVIPSLKGYPPRLDKSNDIGKVGIKALFSTNTKPYRGLKIIANYDKSLML